jgi:hypothetical protein
VFDVLNAIEDRLNATNSAVVLAAIKAFLHLTLDMAATHQQVRWVVGVLLVCLVCLTEERGAAARADVCCCALVWQLPHHDPNIISNQNQHKK